MKVVKYGKYTGEPADVVDLDELMKRLGDFFLQSGFESQYYGLSEFDSNQSMEALRDAILRALQEGDLRGTPKRHVPPREPEHGGRPGSLCAGQRGEEPAFVGTPQRFLTPLAENRVLIVRPACVHLGETQDRRRVLPPHHPGDLALPRTVEPEVGEEPLQRDASA